METPVRVDPVLRYRFSSRRGAFVRVFKLFGLVLVLGLLGGEAGAFGTVAGLGGQNAEHERITRRALGCDAGGPCVGALTLDMIGGRWSKGEWVFGAVGAPDRSERFLESEPHCDNADRPDLPNYPDNNHFGQPPQALLEACRDLAARKLTEAVEEAGAILDSQGRVRASQTPTDCVFWFGIPGRAKCNALEAFGAVLHVSQDFYSHSNWTDRPDPARPVSAENPPGLGNTGPAPWMSLRAGGDTVPPPGLFTGCFALPSEVRGCSYPVGDRTMLRVIHANLSKDTGPIDPEIGQGTTPRGAVEGNFRRAVEAAIADSRDKWRLLEERLVARYGAVRGARIACALRADKPVYACRA